MPSMTRSDTAPPRARASSKYESLTPLEAALVDQIADGQDRVVAAVDRLADKAPSPKLVAAVGASVALGFLALVVFLASLIASGQGIDPRIAAEATKGVVEAVVEEAPLPAPPVEPAAVPVAPPVKDEAPATAPVTSAEGGTPR